MALKNTHTVIDLSLTEDEGSNDCFEGTRQECDNWVSKQTDYFIYRVVAQTTLGGNEAPQKF